MLSKSERWVLGIAFLIACALRLTFVVPGWWEAPWTPHHFDEHILPYEALALWEGVAPREVGWPASTVRVTLSAVYGARMLWDQRAALRSVPNPADALAVISQWSGDRVADAAPLFQIGRLVVALFGIAQVLLTVLAARAWFGARAMPLAAAIGAISPIAVTHSQFVLADVAGACFASLLLLLLSTPRGRSAPVWLGVVAGLAAASKLNFGVWLIPAIAVCWRARQSDGGPKGGAVAVVQVLAGFLLLMMALVPWAWIDPVLGMKEFVGMTLVKIGGGGGSVDRLLGNLDLVFGGLGWALLACAAPGLLGFLRSRKALELSVAAVIVTVVVLYGGAAIVFDRYGLVILPGLALAATAGAQRLAERLNVAPALVVSALLVLGLPQTLLAVSQIAQRNSYHLAHDWMMAHLPDGASVVLYDEDPQYLPRTQGQLAACAAYVWSGAAYAEKLASNDLRATSPAVSGLPMRSAVLNDEIFHAFWCSRERLRPHSPAFAITRFHDGKRFQTIDVATLRSEFDAGLTDSSRGFDAVLVHWPLEPALTPAMTFSTALGPTLRLYLRPGLLLRDVSPR